MKINHDTLDDIYWDGEDAFDYLPRIKGMTQDRWVIQYEKIPRHPREMEQIIHNQLDTLKEYNFTYEASRHEEWWLIDSLLPFFDQQWFDDVLKIVKGGKEASVYLCQANSSSDAELLAAKVYRPRSLRNLRNDHIYREGRQQLDSDGLNIIKERQLKAIRKRTAYGKDLMHTSWIEHEFLTLTTLHQAGCNVPEPYARGHNAILMEFIGNRQMAAPTLNGIHLSKDETKKLFERVLLNLDIMLTHERVHGDLSAYNILYWEKELYMIDFPQAISPNQNPNAYVIFQRDVTRICEYFQKHGVNCYPNRLAEDLWSSHGYSTMPNLLWQEDLEGEF